MTKSEYEKITSVLRNKPSLARGAGAANKILTYIIFAAYPFLLIILAVQGSSLIIRAIAVPAVSFAAFSIIRRIINLPRPYEVFGIPPVYSKKTKGKSFPSRHVFSVAIIGMTYLACLPTAIPAAVIIITAVLMGILRVISGVHFPRDVIVGFLCGIVAGIVGFYLI